MKYATSGVLSFIFIGALTGTTVAQCGSIDRDSPAAVSQEVNRLQNESLDAMQYTLPSGVKAATWMPPDESVRDQIRCLGSTAVPAIIELLQRNHRSFGSYSCNPDAGLGRGS
jgi:hypothetical protein